MDTQTLKKKTKHHKPSDILNDEENQLVFSLISPKCLVSDI